MSDTIERSQTHATFVIERSYPVPVSAVWHALSNNEARDQWFGGGPELEDWFGCLDLILSGALDPRPLIGETVRLEDLPDAFERARSASAPVRIVFTP